MDHRTRMGSGQIEMEREIGVKGTSLGSIRAAHADISRSTRDLSKPRGPFEDHVTLPWLVTIWLDSWEKVNKLDCQLPARFQV